ncbi:MAG: hypothetical protein K8R90_05290 [Candidatus Cloacimonetes bacterium]|nr:hypothetical protein [Candidatus Cloacimonadota bacterium]
MSLSAAIRDAMRGRGKTAKDIAEQTGDNLSEIVMAIYERTGFDPLIQHRTAEALSIDMSEDAPKARTPVAVEPEATAPQDDKLTRQRKQAAHAGLPPLKGKPRKPKEKQDDAEKVQGDGVQEVPSDASLDARPQPSGGVPAGGTNHQRHERAEPAAGLPDTRDVGGAAAFRERGLPTLINNLENAEQPVIYIEITRGDMTTKLRIPLGV